MLGRVAMERAEGEASITLWMQSEWISPASDSGEPFGRVDLKTEPAAPDTMVEHQDEP